MRIGLAAGVLGGFLALRRGSTEPIGMRGALGIVRPPGSLEETDFMARCIRCTRCADSCERQCILFFGLIALLAPNTMQMTNHGLSYDRRFLYKRNSSAAFIAGCAAGLGALLLFTTTGSEFLYFNF